MPARRSATERVYESLKAALLAGALPVGALDIRRLGDSLRVSATPVREALVRLASEELVRFSANRGFRVAPPTPGELADLYGLSSLLLQQALFAVPRALRRCLATMPGPEGATRSMIHPDSYALAVTTLFGAIAASQPNAALAGEINRANDRLALARRYEAKIVPDSSEDIEVLTALWMSGEGKVLRFRLRRYFTLRIDAADRLSLLIREESRNPSG